LSKTVFITFKRLFLLIFSIITSLNAYLLVFAQGQSAVLKKHQELFEQIKQGTLKRYPKLNLFEGWGMSAQNLEGAILRKVMLEGIEKGIVSLPVHDAIAVKQGDAEWAKEAMSRLWTEETLGCKTRLKVDYPD
jgi:hypothetical protein